jgi:choline dehydrogenase-like flavoprotein
MRKKPRVFETDVLGRPNGFRRIHVVDATIFPDIPSGPITLTVMANAYRIGTDHDLGA